MVCFQKLPTRSRFRGFGFEGFADVGGPGSREMFRFEGASSGSRVP